MADKGKKVSIKLPDGTIGDIPEENVQAAIERGASLIGTAPPPKGIAGMPSALAKKIKQFEPSTYIEAAKEVVKPVGEFMTGVVSSVAQQPVGIARLAGIEPSSVTVPTELAEAGRSAVAAGLGPAFSLAETVSQLVKPDRKPSTTLAEAVKAPETFAGKAGELTADIAGFAIPYTAATKLPAVASLTQKAPKIARAADLLASNILSSSQEYAKTGDWDKAVDSAGLGLMVDLGLRGAGGAVKGVAPAVSDLLARWSLPLKARFGQKAKNAKQYHKELADRMIKTSSKFTDKGLDEVEKRFSTVVGAMKNASKEADELMDGLRGMGLVSPDETKIVDFKSEMVNQFNDLVTATKGLKEKNSLKEAFDSLMGDMPTGKLSFAEAELEKERLNRTLSSLYDKGVMPVDLGIDKKIKVMLNDSIRKAQNKAFDELKNTKEALSGTGKIPIGSPADLLTPWNIEVPGEEVTKTYKEVQKLAMMDADILGAGWGANLKMTPQADYSYYNPMASAIALSQLTHASLFTPSQVATGFRMGQSPVSSSRMASGLYRFSKKPPVTGIPPSFGRAATRASGLSKEERKAEELPPSLMTQPELPTGTDYWGQPLNR